MAKRLVEKFGNCYMVHHTGMTKFKGCQCFKDCLCAESFVPAEINMYRIVRRAGSKKQKTTLHSTLEEAMKRWRFVKSLDKEETTR